MRHAYGICGSLRRLYSTHGSGSKERSKWFPKKVSDLYRHYQNSTPHYIPYGEDGSGFYSDNALGHYDIITNAKPIVMDAINSMEINPTQIFNIVDYGSADGGTSMPLFYQIVDKLRQTYGDALPIHVTYEDQPVADFKSLFMRLHGLLPMPDNHGYLKGFNNVYVSACGTSFYDQEEFVNTNIFGYKRVPEEVQTPFVNKDSRVRKAGLTLVCMETKGCAERVFTCLPDSSVRGTRGRLYRLISLRNTFPVSFCLHLETDRCDWSPLGSLTSRNPSSDPRIFSSGEEPEGAVLDVTTPGVKSGQDDSSDQATHGNRRPAAGAVRGAERGSIHNKDGLTQVMNSKPRSLLPVFLRGLGQTFRHFRSKSSKWVCIRVGNGLHESYAAVHSAVYRVEPEPTAVLRGQTATIRCSFNSLSPSSIVEWFGPPNLQHISQGTTVAAEYPRHRVVGDTSRGNYELQIRRTRPEDEGMYRCRTFPLPPAPDVKLTVVEPLSGPPDIVGNERPQSAGQGLTLTCRAVGGRPPPRLTWYNGTVPFRLPESAHNTSPQNNEVSLSLAIPFVSRWDNAANFSCRADQGLPTLVEPRTASKMLSVQFPPEARVLVTSMRVKAGHSVNLTCVVSSNPPAVVTWQKLGEASVVRGEVRGQSLLISNVQKSDAGVYRCKAENGVLPDGLARTTLDVQYAPDIKATFAEKVVVLYGQDGYSLDCTAEGNPQPIVRWRRKGTNFYLNNPLVLSQVTLPESAHNTSPQNNEVSLSLAIPFVSRWDNAANFSCRADQGLPTLVEPRTASKILSVQFPPEARVLVTSMRVKAGHSVNLTCVVSSNPPAVVTWQKLGEASLVRGEVRGQSLLINNVQKSDAGVYRCKAENGVLPDGLARTTLDVQCKETIFLGAEEDSISVREVPMTGGRRSTLVIREVGAGQAGSYVCKATNMFGSDQREFLIEIQAVQTAQSYLNLFSEDSQVLLITVVTATVLILIVVTVVTVLLVRRNRCHISDQESVASSEPVSKPMPPLPPKHGPMAQAQEKPREMSLELDELDGTLKPRPPPRLDKDPYSIGLSYPRLIHALPAYSVKDQQMKTSDNNSPLDDNSGNPVQTREGSGIESWKLTEANSRRPPNYHEIHVLE
uniref:Ig-like domain-containing protein n=1 Tax=Branchiostoma floridae TaxID=7739 RepID=C3Y5W6_BRAFL|eukprot:XP_002608353.1 hypothetical protein BRAFLDRAFT_126235 [Branchiostoma floridae]